MIKIMNVSIFGRLNPKLAPLFINILKERGTDSHLFNDLWTTGEGQPITASIQDKWQRGLMVHPKVFERPDMQTHVLDADPDFRERQYVHYWRRKMGMAPYTIFTLVG